MRRVVEASSVGVRAMEEMLADWAKHDDVRVATRAIEGREKAGSIMIDDGNEAEESYGETDTCTKPKQTPS